jgi:hypothetical protein
METPAPARPVTGLATRPPRRCNADYRWTMPKVTAFLEALAQSGCVAEAARAVGMSRQSAYRLRAGLAGTRFDGAFEGARKLGIRARFVASQARARSRWEGPGLAALVALHRASGAPVQRDAVTAQGDAPPGQGDGFPPKVTELALDSVTCVTSRPERRAIRRLGEGVLHDPR